MDRKKKEPSIVEEKKSVEKVTDRLLLGIAAAYYEETIELALAKVSEELDKQHVSYLKEPGLEYLRNPENPTGPTTGASLVIYISDMGYKEILKIWDSMSELFAYHLHPYLRGYVHLVLRRASSRP
ncbi:MAG TPA: hypothetical protein VFE98_02910 [Candidatus Bathyarchaeia archaeon]|nr:hypothetical protein [Candidatus Bathyarchaeia archaeon]